MKQTNFAKSLWRENADLAQTTLEHPFVRGPAQGTLTREDFRHYIAQDTFYLESFARAYALDHNPDRRELDEFSALISGAVKELRLHEDYAERWGVDLSWTVPGDATLGSVGVTCAAMVPCMRLYAFLGQSLAQEDIVEGNPYREWIEPTLPRVSRSWQPGWRRC